MKLLELFLYETTEEDRAIISLASAISEYLQKYENTYDADLDYDDTETDEFDIHGGEDKPIELGLIGQLFDTPLEIMNSVRLELQSDYGIRQRRKKDTDAETIKKPGEEDIHGLWYPGDKIIVLNADYIGSNNLKSVVAHELRHALDDFKSGFRASISKKYSSPKDRKLRRASTDPKADPVLQHRAYLAKPEEINARFLQVLHGMTPVIRRAANLESEKGKALISKRFKELMAYYRIPEQFRHKENDRGYKRLIKRATDYIQKEYNYQLDQK